MLKVIEQGYYIYNIYCEWLRLEDGTFLMFNGEHWYDVTDTIYIEGEDFTNEDI